MNRAYKEALAGGVEKQFSELEERIMQDVVRRIKKTGDITSTADYQINRLMILGNSSEDIENYIKRALDASYPQMFELYDKVIDSEYVRNKDIYEQVNANFVPYEENDQLQQITDGLRRQSQADIENITQSLGFALDYGNGKRVFTPLSEVYQGYLDAAMMDIASGAFDYNSVLRKVITQMTNSGLRSIDYASGYCSRAPVAARRAIMTGITQLTGHITDMNAEKLGTQHFEVAWHENARPTHRVWQGKVWTKEQLVTVCGLGSVTGLCGANCYHEYYPFIPGISERNWSDNWLQEQNHKEDVPKTFRGKPYTAYEATQKQRNMETAMRAQREKVELLKAGGADLDEVMLARAKYQGQLGEYSHFCAKMDLTQQRERVYMDMRGRVAPTTITHYNKKPVAKQQGIGIIKSKKDMNRKAGNTGAFKELPERMSKDHIRNVAKEYGVDLKGLTLHIDRSTELLRIPFAGRADPENVGGITFFPNAFRSKKELLSTLYHEKLHAEQFREFGVEYVQNNREYFEALTYGKEKEFITGLEKRGLL